MGKKKAKLYKLVVALKQPSVICTESNLGLWVFYVEEKELAHVREAVNTGDGVWISAVNVGPEFDDDLYDSRYEMYLDGYEVSMLIVQGFKSDPRDISKSLTR